MHEAPRDGRVGRALLQLTFVMGAGLFVEVMTAMGPLLRSGGNAWAWLPVVFLPVAAALTLAVQLFDQQDVFRGFRVVMGLAVLVGMLGTLFHLMAHGFLGTGAAHVLSFSHWAGQPPIFAPMSFGVMGVLGWFAAVEGCGTGRAAGRAAVLGGLVGVLTLLGMVLNIVALDRGMGLLLISGGTALELVDLTLEWFWWGGPALRVVPRGSESRRVSSAI